MSKLQQHIVRDVTPRIHPRSENAASESGAALSALVASHAAVAQERFSTMADQWNPGFRARFSVRFLF